MIDCKKLAATPLHELERGSDEFFVAIACRHDVAEDQHKCMTDMSVTLDVLPSCVSRWIKKGHNIRDRHIREESIRMLRKIGYGEIPAPKIDKSVPDVLVVAVSRMVPPREKPIPAFQEPSPLQRDPSFYEAEAAPMVH